MDAIHAMVPAISRLNVEVSGNTLLIRGMLHRRSRSYSPFYAPTTSGGWSMQVFLDNDPFRTVYWHGFDYVVRGVEWSQPLSTFAIRHITLDPNTPGGWGPQVGNAKFRQIGQRFEVAVPLQAIGGIERGVNYCVETYATLDCPACDGGLTQEWADNYFGSAGDVHERRSHGGPFIAGAMPRPGHTAAMDMRLIPR